MKQRLQKIIAGAGITSRRKAEALIREGYVSVNGCIVTQLGSQADALRDRIEVNGTRVRPEPLEYYVLNKPRGVLSSRSDPWGRPIATQFIKSGGRLYPSGRLDFQSEGLLILTNDGELTRRVTQAGNLEKVYHVKVRGLPSWEELRKLGEGIRMGRRQLGKCRITPLKEGNNPWYEVILCEGKNRQIHRMFERIGHRVSRLRRIAIGPVRLGDLSPGAYRRLTAREVGLLKRTGGTREK